MQTRKKIFILAKTYPTPSEKNTETSCIAGIDEDGNMVRLFPVPFRLMSDTQKFSKWQWIEILTSKAVGDNRAESHKVFIDSNSPKLLDRLNTKKWHKRAEILNKVPTFESYDEMEEQRIAKGITLAILKPSSIINLEIEEEKNKEWTQKELEKLMQSLKQPDLFSPVAHKELNILRKMPYKFHYNYTYSHNGQTIERRNMITDWEAGALYWNCAKDLDWEDKFRKKYEQEMIQSGAYFLMGTMHRFPGQWLIISVIYPQKTKQTEELDNQGLLF